MEKNLIFKSIIFTIMILTMEDYLGTVVGHQYKNRTWIQVRIASWINQYSRSDNRIDLSEFCEFTFTQRRFTNCFSDSHTSKPLL